MISDILQDAQQRMKKSVDALRHELVKLRTGRAHTSLLDHISVDYYGNQVPLSQASTVTVSDPRTLTVTPWEPKMVPVIEKAIMNSDLGLTPATAGTVIRIPLPPLTEERRRDLTKVVGHEAENAKVAIRNVRRDANHHMQELKKSKEISEDEERHGETEIQKLTDKFVAEADKIAKAKEEELLEV